jgi:hypothetical protein
VRGAGPVVDRELRVEGEVVVLLTTRDAVAAGLASIQSDEEIVASPSAVG